MNSEYERGWREADDDISTGLAKLGDPGFQPPMNDYQCGYNNRIDADRGARMLSRAIGLALIVALGIATVFALGLVLYLH